MSIRLKDVLKGHHGQLPNSNRNNVNSDTDSEEEEEDDEDVEYFHRRKPQTRSPVHKYEGEEEEEEEEESLNEEEDTPKPLYLIQWDVVGSKPEYVELNAADETKDTSVEDRWHRLYPPYLPNGTRISATRQGETKYGKIIKPVTDKPGPTYIVKWNDGGDDEEIVLSSDGEGKDWNRVQLPPALQPGDRVAIHYAEGWWKGTVLPSKNNPGVAYNGPKVALILDMRNQGGVEQFLVRFVGMSYLKLKWHTRVELMVMGAGTKVENFCRKRLAQNIETGGLEEEREVFNPINTEVDRIVDHKKTKNGVEYLVKWKGLAYDDLTWESELDIDAPTKIQLYHQWRSQPNNSESVTKPTIEQFMKSKDELGKQKYKGDNKLRDYQIEGYQWLAFSWLNGRSVILADEMGLGKTVQVIVFLEYIRKYGGKRGPFLIVAPLSTLGHWQREVETWTDMNAIIYHGSQKARDTCYQHEFYYGEPKARGVTKFHLIITTYEIIAKDPDRIGNIRFECVVLDEGHRIKNPETTIFNTMRQIPANHRVLLTGTPIQNQIGELFTLLNFLDPKEFPSRSDFLAAYGSMNSSDTVKQLHKLLNPYLLRRVKEDVEKSIPPKIETLVKIRLTNAQKMHYKAVVENNREFLNKGIKNKANVPRLVNIMMQLRKVCNHPYLLVGAEQRVTEGMDNTQKEQQLVRSSSKMVLVDKLLQKLRSERRRVLIFSQMTMMLDILEDFVRIKGYPYERLDGSVMGSMRQLAIDRFSDKNRDGFVFLLSTKAGGVGINLTAADTVIIYDSDWNPQNDIQAQARVHRIGQKSDVKVYRLITESTYEEKMFEVASMKLGLDRAVLAGKSVDESGDRVSDRIPLTHEQIDVLLKKGAYELYKEGEGGEDELWLEEDLDGILQRATTVDVNQSGAVGIQGLSSFSKAVFKASSDSAEDVDLNDDHFWEKILPEVVRPSSLRRRLTDNTALSSAKQKQRFMTDLRGYFDKCLAMTKELVPPDAKQQQEITALIKLLQDIEENEFEGENGVKFVSNELSEISEMQKLLQLPRSRKGPQAEMLAEARAIRNLPPTPELWTSVAITTFLEKFVVFGWAQWDKLQENLKYSTRIDLSQVRCLSEAIVQMSFPMHIRRYGPRSHQESLYGYSLKDNEEVVNQTLAGWTVFETYSPKVDLNVTYEFLRDVIITDEEPSSPAEALKLAMDVPKMNAPSELPLQGQLMNLNMSNIPRIDSLPTDVQEWCIVCTLSLVCDSRLVSKLECGPSGSLPIRAHIVPMNLTSVTIPVPGYFGDYEIRCFVAGRANGEHTHQTKLASEYCRTIAADSKIQVGVRSCMRVGELQAELPNLVRPRAPCHGALASLVRERGVDLNGVRPIIEASDISDTDLPDWWVKGESDVLLLKGFYKYGLLGNCGRILHDPTLFNMTQKDSKIDKHLRQALEDRFRALMNILVPPFTRLLHGLHHKEDQPDTQISPLKPRALLEQMRKSHFYTLRRILMTHGLCPTPPLGRPDWNKMKLLEPSLGSVPIEYIEACIIDSFFFARWANTSELFTIPFDPKPKPNTTASTPEENSELQSFPPTQTRTIDKNTDLVRTSISIMYDFATQIVSKLSSDIDPNTGVFGSNVPELVSKWSELVSLVWMFHPEREKLLRLPSYWSSPHDWDLIRGVFKHGLDMRAVTSDSELCFNSIRTKMVETRKQREANRKMKKEAEASGSGNPEDPIATPTPETPSADLSQSSNPSNDRLPPLLPNYQRVLTSRIFYLCAAAIGDLDHLPSCVQSETKEEQTDEQPPKKKKKKANHDELGSPKRKAEDDGQQPLKRRDRKPSRKLLETMSQQQESIKDHDKEPIKSDDGQHINENVATETTTANKTPENIPKIETPTETPPTTSALEQPKDTASNLETQAQSDNTLSLLFPNIPFPLLPNLDISKLLEVNTNIAANEQARPTTPPCTPSPKDSPLPLDPTTPISNILNTSLLNSSLLSSGNPSPPSTDAQFNPLLFPTVPSSLPFPPISVLPQLMASALSSPPMLTSQLIYPTVPAKRKKSKAAEAQPPPGPLDVPPTVIPPSPPSQPDAPKTGRRKYVKSGLYKRPPPPPIPEGSPPHLLPSPRSPPAPQTFPQQQWQWHHRMIHQQHQQQCQQYLMLQQQFLQSQLQQQQYLQQCMQQLCQTASGLNSISSNTTDPINMMINNTQRSPPPLT